MNRKDEHVSLAKAFHKEKPSDFDHVHVIHHSFPELAVSEITLHTEVAGLTLDTPFFINAMTGGSEKTKEINGQLAHIARETGLAMATGSVSAAIKDPSVADSFTIVRETNPNGLIFANVGAGTSLERAIEAVELFKADALQIHVNAPQEMVMPEGDRDFSNWLTDIGQIVKELPLPVIVKEVGFGMSRESMNALLDQGVQVIDISGRGGTSFTQIENARRVKREFSYLDDFGQSTVQSLLEANEIKQSFDVLASGGIRNAFDIFKSLSLGAKAVGVSGEILTHLLSEGVDETITLINQWKNELITLYALTGCKSTADTSTVDIYFSGPVNDWCNSRNIPLDTYSFRSTR